MVRRSVKNPKRYSKKKLLRNKSKKRSKLNIKSLGKKKTRHRKQSKPWKKRTMRGGMRRLGISMPPMNFARVKESARNLSKVLRKNFINNCINYLFNKPTYFTSISISRPEINEDGITFSKDGENKTIKFDEKKIDDIRKKNSKISEKNLYIIAIFGMFNSIKLYGPEQIKINTSKYFDYCIPDYNMEQRSYINNKCAEIINEIKKTIGITDVEGEFETNRFTIKYNQSVYKIRMFPQRLGMLCNLKDTEIVYIFYKDENLKTEYYYTTNYKKIPDYIKQIEDSPKLPKDEKDEFYLDFPVKISPSVPDRAPDPDLYTQFKEKYIKEIPEYFRENVKFQKDADDELKGQSKNTCIVWIYKFEETYYTCLSVKYGNPNIIHIVLFFDEKNGYRYELPTGEKEKLSHDINIAINEIEKKLKIELKPPVSRANKPGQATLDDDFTEQIQAIEKEPWFIEIDKTLEEGKTFVEKEYLNGQPEGAFIVWKTTDTNGRIKLCLSYTINKLGNKYKHFEIKKGINSEYYLSTEMGTFMRSNHSVKDLIKYCKKKKKLIINTTPVPPQALIEELYDNITREKALEILTKKIPDDDYVKEEKEYPMRPYLIRKSSKQGGQYAISLLNKDNVPESKLFVYFSGKYYFRGNGYKKLEDVKNLFLLNSNYKITLKPIKRLVVWDFDETFMKDHWWTTSQPFKTEPDLQRLEANPDKYYKKLFELTLGELGSDIKDCLSYEYMESLLKKLDQKGVVLAIASFGESGLIKEVLKNLGFLKYFKNTIFTPKSTEIKEYGISGVKKNDIKDKGDVFFFDDDPINIAVSQNTNNVAERMGFKELNILHNNINATYIDNDERQKKQKKPGFIQENVDKLMEDLGLSF